MLSYARRYAGGQGVKTATGHRLALSCQWQTWRTLTGLSERQKAFELKYADKLRQRLKSEGLSDLKELKKKVCVPSNPPRQNLLAKNVSTSLETAPMSNKAFKPSVRKDSSPIKPLADFMDIQKILAKEHTPEQVSALWTAYHASLSQKTGRGFLSATIPLDTYNKLTGTAKSYSAFLLSLPRLSVETQEKAHELFFLQWGFHEAPPHPLQTPFLPFDSQLPPLLTSVKSNPSCSTILFTPLQEYKLRQAFAQPYLVITNYTDLATTYGIILMRGEITASPTSPGKYLLSQTDAQLLAMSLQRFYLAVGDETAVRRADLLKQFHEKPEEFRWEELVALEDPAI